MKVRFEYPVNGEDIDIFVDGETDGEHFDIHKLSAKYRSVEILRVEDVQSGLLAETELADEIINIAKAVMNDKISTNLE
jgi:hypothetical protein